MAWKWSTNFVLLLLDPENWRCQCAIDGFPIAWKTRHSMHVTSLKLLTARRTRLYMAMLTRSASIGGLADNTYCLERSTLAMSQQRRIVCREVLYPCSFSMACTCSWTATVSSSSRIFCSTNAAIILEGWPEPGLLAICQFPDTFCICKPFFIARITLTLVEGTVTKRTNT